MNTAYKKLNELMDKSILNVTERSSGIVEIVCFDGTVCMIGPDDFGTHGRNEITSRKAPIIGQEAICPDGLGRVIAYEEGPASSVRVQVQTYVNDRSCKWDISNVELIDPRRS